MEIRITDGLAEYMRRKGCRTLSLEVAKTEHSDLEVTELYVRTLTEKHAAYLKEKMGYRRFEAGDFEVLLPPYRLTCGEEVTFSVKKLWIFTRITVEGIEL